MSKASFTYRAFLSYSHADTAVARRVHARLEGFRLGADLVGRETPRGPVPSTLRPIFRDRNDFDAGGVLAEQTLAALDASAALIVLASPQAARSAYVDEEVRLFKTRHPDRPVVPLIVAGRDGDATQECFPPALRFEVADGAITDRLANPLAADLREAGDGFTLALAKVVARLIDVPPDDVFRRAERERRRQGRLRAAVAACIAVLAVFGAAIFQQSRRQGASLAEIDALVQRYSLVTPARAAAQESLTQALTAIAEGAATDPRYAKALDFLKAGKPAEAEPLLKAVADDKARRAAKDGADAAAAYRNLASIAAVSNPKRARDFYAEAARLDPKNIDGMLMNGDFQQNAGNLEAAESAYRTVIALAKGRNPGRQVLWASIGLGDIARDRGRTEEAFSDYDKAEAIAEGLKEADPSSIRRNRDLTITKARMGDVLASQGRFGKAVGFYRGLVEIDRILAHAAPRDRTLQRDLAIALNKVGDAQQAQEDLPGALASYREGLKITDRLAKADAGNPAWKSDLVATHDRIGDVFYQQHEFADAEQAYKASLAMSQTLAQVDPGNRGWQRGLLLAYEKLGNVALGRKDAGAAMTAYVASRDVAEKLTSADPGNAQWQRDNAVSQDHVASALEAQGKLLEALDAFRQANAIYVKLSDLAPGDAELRHDLAMTYERLAWLQNKLGRAPETKASLESGRTILQRLVSKYPDRGQWKKDLALFEGALAELH